MKIGKAWDHPSCQLDMRWMQWGRGPVTLDHCSNVSLLVKTQTSKKPAFSACAPPYLRPPWSTHMTNNLTVILVFVALPLPRDKCDEHGRPGNEADFTLSLVDQSGILSMLVSPTPSTRLMCELCWSHTQTQPSHVRRVGLDTRLQTLLVRTRGL